jgi:hypothetical protein
MRYETKYNYIQDEGFPPLLARLTDDPSGETSGELYLAVPKKWIPIGYPVIPEMMFTGEWDGVRSRDVDALIERIEARRRPERVRYWLLSQDPDAPHVIVCCYDDGPLESYVLSKREWVTLSPEDPLLELDRADWDEMLLDETGVVRQRLDIRGTVGGHFLTLIQNVAKNLLVADCAIVADGAVDS